MVLDRKKLLLSKLALSDWKFLWPLRVDEKEPR